LLPDSRTKSDSVFESVKSKIINALQNDPGVGLTKLSTAVDEEKTLVQSIERAMVQAGELKTRGAKKGTVYFTAAWRKLGPASGFKPIPRPVEGLLSRCPNAGRRRRTRLLPGRRTRWIRAAVQRPHELCSLFLETVLLYLRKSRTAPALVR